MLIHFSLDYNFELTHLSFIMLIYIHVPFCRRKCGYCAFHSEALFEGDSALNEILLAMPLPEVKTVDSWESQSFATPQSKNQLKIQKWLDTLMIEIETSSKRLGKPSVKTIFFGGGTPSLLEPEIIDTIMKKLKRYFKVDAKAEVTLEANPESLDSAKKVKEYLSAGINRISIGVQSLDDNMLVTLGRVHTVGDAFSAIYNTRKAGCRNINVDMMWALPQQRVSQWITQLMELIKLKPDHISAYGLTLEPNTPFALAFERGELILPKETEQTTMYMRGSEILQENGYLQYEISNYSRMGFQCRHNLGYWEGQEYLGLGPSATSTVAGTRWTNPNDLDIWAENVRSGRVADDIEILSLQDRVIELIMLRLRTARGMRIKAYTDLTKRDFLKDNKQLIHALHKNGLLRMLNGYIRLTRNGFLVSNSILSHLFENTKKQLALGEDIEYLNKLAERKEKQTKIIRGISHE